MSARLALSLLGSAPPTGEPARVFGADITADVVDAGLARTAASLVVSDVARGH